MSLEKKKVAKVSDLKNGEMKTIELGEGKEILLSKIDDKFFAIGAHCTHYGAPLAEGFLNGDRIVCPWHHACFNAKNGDLLEPPARDSLPNFKVSVEGNNVYVELPEELPFSRMPDMVKKDTEAEKRKFVIAGAGVAGNAAAQAMREAGFKGEIIMITGENHPPYDRPNLSKEYLQGEAEPDWMPLRSDDFYKEYGIELKLKTIVNAVDVANKNLSLGNDETLKYDKLLLTTGGIPRKLNIPGSDLKNIFYLRSFDDADNIIGAANNAKKAVVIGASFIALESAFGLKKRGLDVTVAAPENLPFEKIFGEEIGSLIKKQHESEGIKFKLGNRISEFKGDSAVNKVMLKDNSEIETDLVLVGIGVKPATEFLEGINLVDDGSIMVDKHFHATQDVYAAGDIATFADPLFGSGVRIEHYRTAEQEGRIAGFNMAGKSIEFRSDPFFWTVQAGLTINYVGHVKDWDEIIIDGNVHQKEFIAYYIKDNIILAAAGINKDKDMAVIQELIRLNKMPEPEALRDHSANIHNLLD